MTNCINIFPNKLFDNSHKQIVFINNYEVKNVYSSIKFKKCFREIWLELDIFTTK